MLRQNSVLASAGFCEAVRHGRNDATLVSEVQLDETRKAVKHCSEVDRVGHETFGPPCRHRAQSMCTAARLAETARIKREICAGK